MSVEICCVCISEFQEMRSWTEIYSVWDDPAHDAKRAAKSAKKSARDLRALLTLASVLSVLTARMWKFASNVSPANTSLRCNI